MLNCPKCGSSSIMGPTYDKQIDMLLYVCRRCGYEGQRLPRDRAEAERR